MRHQISRGRAVSKSRLPSFFAAAIIAFAVTSSPGIAAELKATADDGDHGLGFKSNYADINGVKLHYVEGGNAPRVIVLIPGWPQTWYAWRKVMPELAKTYGVIAVDTRGMGDSSRPDDGYDTQTAAADIATLMNLDEQARCFTLFRHWS
jgi:alpha/beta hydrolase fold